MYGNQKQGPLALAYIAGLIDGEGAFMITRSTNWDRPTPSYTPRVKIAMTTREPLDFVVEHLGLGKINVEVVRKKRPKSKDIYQWQVHSLTNVHKLCELILPYLVLKKKHAQHLIEYCEHFCSTPIRNHGVPDDVRAYREEAYLIMRKLNGRHPAAETKPPSIREDEAIVRT
jgi:hypothetical protein